MGYFSDHGTIPYTHTGERETEIPLYAYGIISAGVSLLVLVSIALVTMVCVGTRRRKPKEISTYGMVCTELSLKVGEE